MFRTAGSCKTSAASLLLLLGYCVRASAHLGGDVASVAADAQAMQAGVRTTALLSYQVHEFQSSAGVRVREYVDGADMVFALSWSGAVAPDLQRLLGAHFAAYAAAIAALAHPGLQRAVRIAAGELVVESSGRPRSYFGRAYLPAQLPPDFNVQMLR